MSAAPAIVLGTNVRKPSRYEAPLPYSNTQSSNDQIIGWMSNAIAEGETFLRSQQGYKFIPISHRIMADVGFDELPPTLSKASLNFVKRDVRELIATLANPRPVSAFKCDNPTYAHQAWVLNALYQSWYWESFVDRKLRTALQYAGVEGTGYLMTGWDPGYWGTSKGDIDLTPLGAGAVLPIQISPDDWDLQKAYGVIIRRTLPIVDVIRRYPQLADRISPDGENSWSWRGIWNMISTKVAATVHNTYGRDRGYRDTAPAARALVTVYDIYLQDASVNTTGREIKMGVPGSPWEYTVPTLGGDVPTGMRDTGGRPLVRKADWHDARLYPYRRHITCTRNLVLSDGPSKFWHGQVPLVKFRLDDWPFEYCGIPLTKEPAKPQAMMTSLLRAYDDSANARLRPGLRYDPERVNDEMARSFDPRMGGQVVGIPNMVGEAFELLTDPAYYNQSQDILPLLQWIKEEGTKLTGVHDLVGLQRAAQVPSGDTIEKLTELAGPLCTDMSRNMEASLRDLGEQFKCNAFEFYTAKRRFQLLGPDGLTKEDFDFDPGQLVPDEITLPDLVPGSTRAERARAHMNNFHFSILPNSVYNMTQSTRRMSLLALADRGLPISPWTILEAFDVPNPGKPPVGATTEVEKWQAWQQAQLEMQLEMQAAVQAQQVAMNPLAALGQAIQGAMGTGAEGGADQGSSPKGRQGRPPTAQKTPHMELKDGGTRPAIAES